MVCVVLHGHDDAVFDLSRFESNGSTSACGADLAARAVLMARVCWLIVACFVPDMVSYVAQQFGLLKEADRLRPEQENVLDAWARRKSSTFHVDRIGGGKSLVYSLAHPLGLVNGKLVIIVPLNALARDVERRLAPVAESLGRCKLAARLGGPRARQRNGRGAVDQGRQRRCSRCRKDHRGDTRGVQRSRCRSPHAHRTHIRCSCGTEPSRRRTFGPSTRSSRWRAGFQAWRR